MKQNKSKKKIIRKKNKKINNVIESKSSNNIINKNISKMKMNINMKINDKIVNKNLLKFKPYPEIESPNFYQEIYEKKEFRDSEILETNIHDESSCHPGQFNLSPFQSFLKNYISLDTPYNGVLVMYSTGVGKTCAAISIAEGFKKALKQFGKRILVLTTLRKNFENELFNFGKEASKKSADEVVQCTGKEYEILKDTKHLSQVQRENEIKKMIKNYYQFYGYQKFANHVIKETNGWDGSEEKINEQILKYIHKEFDDRVIIIDEVHNIKTDISEDWKKSIQPILLSIVRHAKNTKLVLMSATPMFDRSDEIIFILNLLLANDGREEVKKSDIFNKDDTLKEEAVPLLRHLLKGYVSYARGERPMVFPFRLSPADAKIPTVEFDMDGRPMNEEEKIKFTKIVDCEMEGIQNRTYMYYYEKNKKKIKFREELEVEVNAQSLEEENKVNKEKENDNSDSIVDKNKISNIESDKEENNNKINVDVKSKFNIKNQPKSLLNNLTYISTVVYPTIFNPENNNDENNSNNSSDNYSNNDNRKKFKLSPYGSYGKEGLENDTDNGRGGYYKPKQTDQGKKKSTQYKYQKHAIINGVPFMDEKYLKEYSSKFYKILQEVKRAQGLCFVYSRYVDDGILPLALMLEQNGFERAVDDNEKRLLDEPVGVKRNKICYKCGELITDQIHHNEKLKDYHQFRVAKYILFFGEQKDIIRITKEEALERFCAKTNMNGEEIKVFLGTKTVSEGLDFKRLRQVHILQPWYNLSRHEQIIGRAIRNCSHIALPIEKRNVEIFQYAATLNSKTKGLKKNTESIDLKYYGYAESKDRVIKRIMRILKQTAVDCNFFKKHNIIDTNESIKQITASGQELMVKVKDEPFSQMCDYEENCNYDCAWKMDPHKHYPINTDTYNLKFGTQDINLAKRIIKLMFKKNNSYHLTDIEKFIHHKNPKIDRIFVFAALDDFINNPKQETIVDKFQRKGYMIYRGEYYIFQPLGYRDDLPMIYREKPSHVKPYGVDLEHITIEYENKNIEKLMNTKNHGMNDVEFNKILQEINDKIRIFKNILDIDKGKYEQEYNNAIYGLVLDKLNNTEMINFLKLLLTEYLEERTNPTKDIQMYSKKYYILQFIEYLKNYFINYYTIYPQKESKKNKSFYVGFNYNNQCLIIKDLEDYKDIEKIDIKKIEFEKCNQDIIHKLKQQNIIIQNQNKEKNKSIKENVLYGYIYDGKFKMVDMASYTGVKTSKGQLSERSKPKGIVCTSVDISELINYHKTFKIPYITSSGKKGATKGYLCNNIEIYLRYKQNIENHKNKPSLIYFYTSLKKNT